MGDAHHIGTAPAARHAGAGRSPSTTARSDGFYGTWFDITGMKSLELRQRSSEQRYRLLFDHLSSGHALHTIEVDEARHAGELPLSSR